MKGKSTYVFNSRPLADPRDRDAQFTFFFALRQPLQALATCLLGDRDSRVGDWGTAVIAGKDGN